MNELNEKQQTNRDEYLADQYAKRSKVRGDYWWRKAQEITGLGDYIPGQDDGEAPKGAEGWN